MDRYVWASSTQLQSEENVLAHATGIRLYDGENKVKYQHLNSRCHHLTRPRLTGQKPCLVFRGKQDL